MVLRYDDTNLLQNMTFQIIASAVFLLLYEVRILRDIVSLLFFLHVAIKYPSFETWGIKLVILSRMTFNIYKYLPF